METFSKKKIDKSLLSLVEEKNMKKLNDLVNSRGADVSTTNNLTPKNFQFVKIFPFFAAALLGNKDAIQCLSKAKYQLNEKKLAVFQKTGTYCNYSVHCISTVTYPDYH